MYWPNVTKLDLPDADELFKKYFIPSNTNKNISITTPTTNDMTRSSFLKEDDKLKSIFYDSIADNDVEFECGDICTYKPANMNSDPYVLDQDFVHKKLSSADITQDIQEQRESLESLFAGCSDLSIDNHLQQYLERALCNKTQKKLKENRQLIKRSYQNTLPKIISSHLTTLGYEQIKMKHYQTIHEQLLHPQFEYRTNTSSKINNHPFYGLTVTKNSEKAKYEEYLASLLLNPLHDYKISYKVNPRGFITNQYQYTNDLVLVDKNGIAINETYNSFLFHILVHRLLSNNTTRIKDLMDYKIPFDESKYPELTKLIPLSIYANFLSELTEQCQINFEIYKSNALDSIILISDSKDTFFYNMRKNVIIYDHINGFWYYQMNGTKCYKTKDFFTMFDDLLELVDQ